MSDQMNQADLANLRRQFSGQIIVPGHPEYDEARTIFNAMIDRRPGVIAQCVDVEDVLRAVDFGRKHGLEMAVRLATTGGRVSTTGVGGFTLGGGGNFGVATSFAFQLHALPSVTAALLLWRPEAGPEVLRAYREFMATAPDEVGGGLIYLTGPAEPFVPAHLVGKQGGMVERGPVHYPVPWRHAPWVVHPFGLWQDPADDECRPQTVVERHGLPQLHRERGGRASQSRLWPGKLRATRPGENTVRPRKPLSLESQHQASLNRLARQGSYEFINRSH